jgi:arylsulfatase A-like enzyme
VQIDAEIGRILTALEEKGVLDNTLIIFSSDHGDYLGDHDLIGKGTFLESSIAIPLIVRPPEGTASKTNGDLVELTDVTATILAFASEEVPLRMDSIPLPNTGLPGSRGRERLIGFLNSGWMIHDGRYKLAKYGATGCTLYDMESDPHEQSNLHGNAAFADLERRLDADLTEAVMNGIRRGNYDKRVYESDLSQNTTFGREGWKRTYPQVLGGAP